MITSMFHVPICHLKVDDWRRKKILLLDILESTTMTDVDHSGEHGTITTDYWHQVVNKTEGIHNESIQSILSDEIMEFLKQANLNRAEVFQSWFETASSIEFHGLHNHGAIGYSSVCYVDYDSEVHKPTHFYAPYLDFINGNIIDHIPEGVEEGSILFFPSAIGHATIPHNTDKTRTIMSFNLKVE
tara:strand:- start:287 stop:844 length:558 start_codon:yes stop_codon:yes gene_type:complete